jgi:hypothetical protein
MQISIISGLLKALKSRICNESRNLINVQILICDVKLQKWDAPNLRPHLGWHGARLSFVALFLMALFRAKTVNLAELATVWGGKAAESSNYKRMQRFFQSFEVKMEQFAKMVMSMASIPPTLGFEP